jgi:hypothetical protein
VNHHLRAVEGDAERIASSVRIEATLSCSGDQAKKLVDPWHHVTFDPAAGEAEITMERRIENALPIDAGDKELRLLRRRAQNAGAADGDWIEIRVRTELLVFDGNLWRRRGERVA